LNSHATDDQLEAYVLDRLAPPELTALEEHLLICCACRERLNATESFTAGMKEALSQEVARPSSAGCFSWSVWIRKPFVSMIFAMLLLVAILSVFSPGHMKFAPSANLTLAANRGAMPATGPARELNFSLADSPTDGSVLRVEIANATGQTVWSGLAQSTQAGVQVKAVQQLPPGDYFVRLHAASGELLREYGFRIRQ
jgi:hypothetical protein